MTIGAPLLAMGTPSALQTQKVAASWAARVLAGELLVRCGDLGAGKTAFTQGFGRALGVTTPITSPTFTLANRYEGDALTVNHLDVYRLSHIDEVRDLGLHELIDGRSVTLVEWGDAIVGALPGGSLEVRLSLGVGAVDRLLEFRIIGPDWADREEGLVGLGAGGDGC